MQYYAVSSVDLCPKKNPPISIVAFTSHSVIGGGAPLSDVCGKMSTIISCPCLTRHRGPPPPQRCPGGWRAWTPPPPPPPGPPRGGPRCAGGATGSAWRGAGSWGGSRRCRGRTPGWPRSTSAAPSAPGPSSPPAGYCPPHTAFWEGGSSSPAPCSGYTPSPGTRLPEGHALPRDTPSPGTRPPQGHVLPRDTPCHLALLIGTTLQPGGGADR